MARQHGFTPEQIHSLDKFETRSDFSEKEKAALAFAEKMTLDGGKVDEATWSRLRTHFDEGEVIELAAAIGLFNYFNRFNTALEMEPTK